MQDSEGEQEDSSDTECKYVCLVFFWKYVGFLSADRSCIWCHNSGITEITFVSSQHCASVQSMILLEMWANAQRDGRPAKYRQRPLFNAAKFGWCPLLECRAVTLLRRETRWNLQGCPKLTKQSQPLVGRSSPYYGDMWRRYCCLTTFFPIVDTCLSCEDVAQQSCGMVPRWRLFGDFLRAVFSASRVQHISYMHSF